MPKILVCLADREEQEAVAGGLRLGKYNVTAAEPVLPEDNPQQAARRLVDEKAAVVVLDYLSDDAASVKLLQAATDMPGHTRFIFVLPESVPVSHILMAVNEGASALVEKPINIDVLVNYVGRAVNGPARFRNDPGREAAYGDEFMNPEREAQSLRAQAAGYRKLITYLMSTPASAQDRSVMIVSDSAYQREQLKKLFDDHGYRVALARDPEEGLRVALEEKPRVVVSDLEMEGKNGVEFCRELKIEHKFMPCFFVVCTANSEKVDAVMAPGNGVDACVLKPSSESGNQELIATASMGLLL